MIKSLLCSQFVSVAPKWTKKNQLLQVKEDDGPAREVFVAIEKAGSSVQRVPGVINCRALWI